MYPTEALERRSGQAHSATDTQDRRSPFAKDRDRLIYSSAFHRLAGKSQVVASTEVGPFHNRLIHSLKVAQLGRRIAERLRERSREQYGDSSLLAPDPDLVEFACLAHDLGHPPFGHAGEVELSKTIDDLIGKAVARRDPAADVDQSRLMLGGFEGNAQSFRIITRLAHKWLADDGLGARDSSPDSSTSHPKSWHGLDVTAASMDAMSKYPWDRGRLDRKKWGLYGTAPPEGDPAAIFLNDSASLHWARERTGATIGHGEAKSFECQLMDWCDDVTYAVHDVEDFYMIGMIPLDRIFSHYVDLSGTMPDEGTENPASIPASSPDANGSHHWTPIPSPEWNEFKLFVLKKWKSEFDQGSRVIEPTADYLDGLRLGLIETCSGLKVWEHDPGSAMGRRASHVRANALIQYFISELTFSGDPFLHSGEFLLAKNPERAQTLQDECDLLKELIWKYVIELPNLTTQQAGQRRIIRELVKAYADDETLLPLHYRDLLDSGGSGYEDLDDPHSEDYAKIRVAADYVSSLTEPHAIALHKRLTGAELGGFRDIV